MSSNLADYAAELYSVFDPQGDVDEFRAAVVAPLLRRVGADLTATDAEAFLVDRIKAAVPEADVETYGAIRSVLVSAMQAILAPIQREVAASDIRVRGLADPSALTRAEVADRLSNIFLSLNDGTQARAVVRVYFSSPRGVAFSAQNEFRTPAGLVFRPSQTQTVSYAEMALQKDGAYYYAAVDVIADAAGADYSVAPGAITSVTGVAGVVRVTNPEAAYVSGLDAETVTEALARGEVGLTSRTLAVQRGIAFLMDEQFPDVEGVLQVGPGASEMARDVIYGVTTVSGVPGGFSQMDGAEIPSGGIHLGGCVDVYMRTTRETDTLNIVNVTPRGVVKTSGIGSTPTAESLTDTFRCSDQSFLLRGVEAGMYLEVGAVRAEIATVTDSEITVVSDVLSPHLVDVRYAVLEVGVFGDVEVPLYDLVGEDANGDTVLTAAGDVALPAPGTTVPWAQGTVRKTVNIADWNSKDAFLYPTSLRMLDPLTLEDLDIPVAHARCVRIEAVDDITADTAGAVRFYFLDATNVRLSADARYTSPYGYVLAPTEVYSGVCTYTGSTEHSLSLSAGTTVSVGDRVTPTSGPAQGVTFCVTAVTTSLTATLVTVRESVHAYLQDYVGVSYGCSVEPGILAANMQQDADTGLYFVDFQMRSLTARTTAAGTVLTGDGHAAEGYRVEFTYPVLAGSVRAHPVLVLSRWVADTTDLQAELTSPAVALSYVYSERVADVQDYFDGDARPVASDILARHMHPALLRFNAETQGLGDTDFAASAEVAATDGLLDVSDVLMWMSGATRVKLPLTVTVIHTNTWQADSSQDQVPVARTEVLVVDQVTL